MNRPHPPELGPLSEGQQMRLRIAARHLDEFRQSNLGTAPPAMVVQTAQRLAATVGDLMSMVQDLARQIQGGSVDDAEESSESSAETRVREGR